MPACIQNGCKRPGFTGDFRNYAMPWCTLWVAPRDDPSVIAAIPVYFPLQRKPPAHVIADLSSPKLALSASRSAVAVITFQVRECHALDFHEKLGPADIGDGVNGGHLTQAAIADRFHFGIVSRVFDVHPNKG